MTYRALDCYVVDKSEVVFFCLFNWNSIEEPLAMGSIMPMVGKGVCEFSWFSGLGSFLGAIVCTGGGRGNASSCPPCTCGG